MKKMINTMKTIFGLIFICWPFVVFVYFVVKFPLLNLEFLGVILFGAWSFFSVWSVFEPRGFLAMPRWIVILLKITGIAELGIFAGFFVYLCLFGL